MSIEKKEKRANIIIVVNWVLLAITVLGILIFFVVSFAAFDKVGLWLRSFYPKPDTSLWLLQIALGREDKTVTKEDVAQILKEGEEQNLKEARALLQATLISVGIIGGVAILITIGLNILLTKGVRTANRSKLRLWIIFQMFGFWMGILSFIIRLILLFASLQSQSWYFLLTDLASIIWIGYSLRIIQDFRDALKGANRNDEENNPDSKEAKPPRFDPLCYCLTCLL